MTPESHVVIIETARESIARNQAAGCVVVVAVSGGPDSVALLQALHRLKIELGLRLIVAHVDHGLRPESADEAHWVSCLAQNLECRFVTDRVDTRSLVASSNCGVEEAARQLRYTFLADVARTHDCRFVVTAHNADDQAETVLHHILRGTGLAGLRGMRECRPLASETALLRPFLQVTRQQICDFLDELEQPSLIDTSNDAAEGTRSRIRHAVLPALRREYAGPIEQSLLRLAQQASDACSLIETFATTQLESVLLDANPQVVKLNAHLLRGLPRHLVREIFRKVWARQSWPRAAMGYSEWDALAEAAAGQGSSLDQLPAGVRMLRRGDMLVLELPRREVGPEKNPAS